jgi:hypothetical protein
MSGKTTHPFHDRLFTATDHPGLAASEDDAGQWKAEIEPSRCFSVSSLRGFSGSP